MKTWPLLFALLCLAGCSCHRDPSATPETAAATATASAPAETAEVATVDPAALAAAREHRAALAAAGSTIHQYLAALPRGAQGGSDAFWSGGHPPPRPDDANLRGIEGLRSLQIRSQAPTALDREQPPRAIEVPVRLTAHTDQGTQRFTGWYRLRARVDGQGWEITSASLQPALD